jgi:hypothetical protein
MSGTERRNGHQRWRLWAGIAAAVIAVLIAGDSGSFAAYGRGDQRPGPSFGTKAKRALRIIAYAVITLCAIAAALSAIHIGITIKMTL